MSAIGHNDCVFLVSLTTSFLLMKARGFHVFDEARFVVKSKAVFGVKIFKGFSKQYYCVQ